MKLEWFELPELEGKKVAKWRRTLAVSDDGTVFVPAEIAGKETEIFLCTGYDGTPYAENYGHIYVPANWMSMEFPKTKEICDFLIKTAFESMHD